MLAAIEGAAEHRTPIIDAAARRSKINAGPTGGRGEHEDLVSCCIRQRFRLVRRDVIAEFRMQKQPLTASAAFRAAVTGDFGPVSRRQIEGQIPF